MMLKFPLVAIAAMAASTAAAAPIAPVSYDMQNGETGSFIYHDNSYSGAGAVNTSLASLSGGLGKLTDGYIELGDWVEAERDGKGPDGAGPFVGWANIVPTIKFAFDDVYDFNSATVHYTSRNAGDVAAPRSMAVDGVAETVVPAGADTFSGYGAYTYDLSAFAPANMLTIALFDGAGPWIFVSEIEFAGKAVAAPIPLPAGGLLLVSGLAGLAVVRRR